MVVPSVKGKGAGHVAREISPHRDIVGNTVSLPTYAKDLPGTSLSILLGTPFAGWRFSQSDNACFARM
jgi:hypothetical protein